jgi:hypothetical protein
MEIPSFAGEIPVFAAENPQTYHLGRRDEHFVTSPGVRTSISVIMSLTAALRCAASSGL